MEGPAVSVETAAWTLERLFSQAGLPSLIPPNSGGMPVTRLTDDSRRVIPGSCFVAVKGTASNGHRFVPTAVDAGAACVVVQEPVSVPEGVISVRLPDTRVVLAKLAATYYRITSGRRETALQLVGVTGTNGKSTTCELLRSILQADGQPTALLGTIQYDLIDRKLPAQLTTPGPMQLCEHLAEAAEAGARWAVMETSSHALDQRRCDGLTFAAGVFTNISGDHLDYHGDMDSYVRAKKRLFDALDADAVAVINADDACAAALVQDCKARVVRYGLDDGSVDIGADDLSMTAAGTRLSLRIGNDRLPLDLRSIGRHNVANALAAAACADALGSSRDSIQRGLEAVRVVRGRLEPVVEAGQDFAVLVDYAHTDDALRRVLAALRPLTAGRLICVFGCGGDRDRTKRPRMAAAVAEQADLAIVTSDNPRTEDPGAIIVEVLTGMPTAGRCAVHTQPDRRKAIQSAIAEARAGDTVLIAGKGHEDYQIIGTSRRHFDDVEEARACLRAQFGNGEVAS